MKCFLRSILSYPLIPKISLIPQTVEHFFVIAKLDHLISLKAYYFLKDFKNSYLFKKFCCFLKILASFII